MASTSRAITATTLGAWLIKARGGVDPVEQLIRDRFSAVNGRCVRATYRTDLIEPGQPVLFWISGSSTVHPAGIYAEGHTTGRATTTEVADDEGVERAGRGRPTLFMPMTLRPLATPVLRSELLGHPSLSQIEVLKMAAGSNPSFVTSEDVRALRSAWPQVTVG